MPFSKRFPNFRQRDRKDCGPACLKIIAAHYKKDISLANVRKLTETTRAGTNLLNLSRAGELMGFRTMGAKINYTTLLKEVPLPCIIPWNRVHFVVVYKTQNKHVYISDPGFGLLKYNTEEFLTGWIGPKSDPEEDQGFVLALEPSSVFTRQFPEQGKEKKISKPGTLFKYAFKYRKLFIQLIIGLLFSSLLVLAFPFLTQAIVDGGIKNHDITFIYIVLAAQLMLFLGKVSIEAIRGWILLHISTRLNISLVADFFMKLMKLPIAFFDTRMTGDILQRINDNQRIQQLLTSTSLNTLFSILNILILGVVLFIYNVKIFLLFLAGSALYILWATFFLKKRSELDYKRFTQLSIEQSKTIELIAGMQEIKLNNAERRKRWDWERIQIKLFTLSVKGLRLEQYQTIGSNFINELKNIMITFISASLVIKHELTLGMMLSIQYIIGSLNSPIIQLVNFIRSAQDAQLSLDRLLEIHEKEDEENVVQGPAFDDIIPGDIMINNLSFKYAGADTYALQDIKFKIPACKVTAIVGFSGSGKTTLMKLLLKFYEPLAGIISVGNTPLNNISHYKWRKTCGVVLQDGHIFNDTIANNIALEEEDNINEEALHNAVKIANLEDLLKRLPLGFNTKIGNEGRMLSGGEKQRILIARAVYKNPGIVFFDEATSSLDAQTERTIMKNLDDFFHNKTVLVIAHRLSTVKNAHNIIVMDKGCVREQGSHAELIEKQGLYFSLVKNQLELEKSKN